MENLIIKCKGCSKQNKITLDISESYSDEREMGSEVFYDGTYDGVCIECGQKIIVNAVFSQYPCGAEMECWDINIHGGEIEE